MKFKELVDILKLYNENAWHDANINVWNTATQADMNLIFCGSVRPSEREPGCINFVVTPKHELFNKSFLPAFSTILERIKNEGIDSHDWKKEFINILTNDNELASDEHI